MHLKQLEITGFKSFADRCKLDFEPGITAVIGPNGCGKSNIIDAIRWCLGEMSAKSLRSSLMMDVVFNGSGSRPPQNMAEVTLTFDNTDKRLPIDFEEVSVTRRLFRSGESEYYINKTQCRLRDIRELFLDTGMGEDGYSSIEQGKVERVLQSKPEERRELFEEAAGISKYRARREEAVRKLDRVEIDLSRLNDIISVTEDQIRKLENAVKKAKTYQQIKEELKTMEVSDWLQQLSKFGTEEKESEERLNTHNKTAEEINTQIHQAESHLSEIQLKMTQAEEELLEANSVLNAIESDIKIGEERLQNSTQRETELVQQIENIKINIQREQERVAELTKQEALQKEELEKLKAEGEGVEAAFAEAQESHKVHENNLNIKTEEVKKARELILERNNKRTETQEAMAQLTSESARFEQQEENSKEEKARIESHLSEIKAKYETNVQSIADLQAQLTEKQNTLASVSEKLEKLKANETDHRQKIMSVTEDMANLQGQIQSIKEDQGRDPYAKGTQEALSQNFPGITGPLGKLFQCSQDDTDLIAATIGEHLGDLVADTMEDAQRVVDHLSQSGKGRARLWILEKIRPMDESANLGEVPLGERLISRIRCEDKYRALLNQLCSTFWVKESTVYGAALINGGTTPSKWTGHVTLKLPELEREYKDKELQKQQLEQQLQTILSEHANANAEKETQSKETEETRVRLEVAEQEKSENGGKLQEIQSQAEEFSRKIQENLEARQKAKEKFEESQRQFNELQAQEKEDHANLDKLQVELAEQQNSFATSNAELTSKAEGHNAFQEKLTWQTSVLEHSINELNAIQESNKRHQESLEQIKVEIETARKTQEEAKELIKTSMEKRTGAADTCAAIQQKRVGLSEQIQNQQKELNRAHDNLSSVKELVQNERVNITTLKNKSETLTQKLYEQYEMTPAQAKEQFPYQAADIEKLEKLKKRIHNIGPINLAAPEEHAELSEKNGFLTTQRDDLVKAKDDLKQVISKINATTREHFRETFDQVRTNFRELYSRLFQGGEADLKLTDESNILTSGIDIFCQPPGKKLLHITLLSGGEKALTAVALLFAFFQVRPSPVALLDEVDAPLDEANVIRYVEMIKTFSEKSQFFVITHSKRTMENSTNLYGVTMEEFGVSKVISARLQSNKEKAKAPVETEAAPA